MTISTEELVAALKGRLTIKLETEELSVRWGTTTIRNTVTLFLDDIEISSDNDSFDVSTEDS